MRYFAFIFLALLLLFMQSCEEQPLRADIGEISLQLRYARLDRDFFNYDVSKPEKAHQELLSKYGSFYELYLEDIIASGPGDDYRTLVLSEAFIRDPYMMETYEAIQSIYTDEKIEQSQQELEQAFKRYRYFLPDAPVPDIVYYHGGFNFGIYSTDSVIGVGLEWFLGAAHPITRQIDFPEYRKQKMDPAFLEVNMAKDWCNRSLYQDLSGADLLEHLIYYGKIMYLLEAMMPDKTEDELMNWPQGSAQWCMENEFNIWRELADEKQTLFESNVFEIQKWIIDGPFTSGLPQESPPMCGIWMGWQMLRSYHRRFPETALKQVLEMDAKEILKSYNPKK